MAALAVVFTGHGVNALQEAGIIAASPAGSFGVSALGVYPTFESLIAQLLVLALVLVLRGRKRSPDSSDVA